MVRAERGQPPCDGARAHQPMALPTRLTSARRDAVSSAENIRRACRLADLALVDLPSPAAASIVVSLAVGTNVAARAGRPHWLRVWTGATTDPDGPGPVVSMSSSEQLRFFSSARRKGQSEYMGRLCWPVGAPQGAAKQAAAFFPRRSVQPDRAKPVGCSTSSQSSSRPTVTTTAVLVPGLGGPDPRRPRAIENSGPHLSSPVSRSRL